MGWVATGHSLTALWAGDGGGKGGVGWVATGHSLTALWAGDGGGKGGGTGTHKGLHRW